MKMVIEFGAQTKRRDDAGPVSALLRGEDSPAALLPFLCCVSRQPAFRSGAVGGILNERARWCDGRPTTSP
jgi:hypothetical protein